MRCHLSGFARLYGSRCIMSGPCRRCGRFSSEQIEEAKVQHQAALRLAKYPGHLRRDEVQLQAALNVPVLQTLTTL